MIVDVSTWQGNIDWNAVKAAGVTFAWIKATEGIGFVDPKFAQNWQAIKAAGIPRGAYYFSRPDLSGDYIAESQFFLDTVKPERGDRLAMDLEVGGGNLNNFAYQSLKHIRDITGIPPFLYTYLSFVFQSLTEPALNEFPLWLADYTTSEPTPPSPFTQIALWQYTSSGTIVGIPGRVDLNSPGIYNTNPWGKLEEVLDPYTLAQMMYLSGLGRVYTGTEGYWLVEIIKKNPGDFTGATLGQVVNSPEGKVWAAKMAQVRATDIGALATDHAQLVALQAAWTAEQSELHKVEAAIKAGGAALGNI
jgi:GH25 family lysozyme M1 (1,4-beta-N-acetylmuramidase)